MVVKGLLCGLNGDMGGCKAIVGVFCVVLAL